MIDPKDLRTRLLYRVAVLANHVEAARKRIELADGPPGRDVSQGLMMAAFDVAAGLERLDEIELHNQKERGKA